MKIGRRQRCGAVLICVLACMLIATSIAATSLYSSLRMRREAKSSFREQQTEWLLKAGVERARANIEKDPNYLGEQWDVPESILKIAAGRVTIATVEEPPFSSDQTQENLRWLKVTAQLISSNEPDTALFQSSYRLSYEVESSD